MHFLFYHIFDVFRRSQFILQANFRLEFQEVIRFLFCFKFLTFFTTIWHIGGTLLLIILSQIFLKIVSKTFYFTSYLKFFLQNNVIILFLGFNLVSTIFFLMNFTWKKKYTADEHVLFMRCRFSGADESIDDRLRT